MCPLCKAIAKCWKLKNIRILTASSGSALIWGASGGIQIRDQRKNYLPVNLIFVSVILKGLSKLDQKYLYKHLSVRNRSFRFCIPVPICFVLFMFHLLPFPCSHTRSVFKKVGWVRGSKWGHSIFLIVIDLFIVLATPPRCLVGFYLKLSLRACHMDTLIFPEIAV